MKKIAMLLALTMTIGTFGGLAEGIDLKSMSDDEILALNDSVHKEMLERKLIKNGELQTGFYIVGKDIAAGRYKISPLKGEDSGYYLVLPSEKHYNDYVELSSIVEIDFGVYETIRVRASAPKEVVFEAGNVLYVAGGISLEEARNGLMP